MFYFIVAKIVESRVIATESAIDLRIATVSVIVETAETVLEIEIVSVNDEGADHQEKGKTGLFAISILGCCLAGLEILGMLNSSSFCFLLSNDHFLFNK